MKKPLRIGIPRALLFHKYYNQWEALFNAFDLEVIASPQTTEEILKDGIKHSVSDFCLSVKLFLGHVDHLKDEIDCLFIPRYVSVENDAYMCPKILGLPDIVKAIFPNLPKILSPKFNIKEGREKTIDEFTMAIARFFSLKHKDVKKAYLRTQSINDPSTVNIQCLRFREMRPTPDPERNNDLSLFTRRSPLNIGIVGRTYTILDDYLGKRIVRQLNRLGTNVIYMEPTREEIECVMRKLPKWVYWSFGKEVVTSASLFLDNKDIDGVINIVNATCGPDSFTGEVIKRFLKGTSTPYMTIVIDEHSSDVGIQTRIEAFTDMIQKVGV